MKYRVELKEAKGSGVAKWSIWVILDHERGKEIKEVAVLGSREEAIAIKKNLEDTLRLFTYAMEEELGKEIETN